MQAQLRESRASIDQMQTGQALDHLKQVMAKFIEMDDEKNEPMFQVILTILSYTNAERKALQQARQRKLAGRSLWGQLVGPTAP